MARNILNLSAKVTPSGSQIICLDSETFKRYSSRLRRDCTIKSDLVFTFRELTIVLQPKQLSFCVFHIPERSTYALETFSRLCGLKNMLHYSV